MPKIMRRIPMPKSIFPRGTRKALYAFATVLIFLGALYHNAFEKKEPDHDDPSVMDT